MYVNSSMFGSRFAKGLTFFLLVMVAIVPSRALGQTTDASVVGRVTDQSGAVLPGVTVTATSPALLVGQVTAISDAEGDYRLSPLPVGTYDITYELSGFQSARQEGLRLTVGFTAKVDVALSIGALTETVTVAGASPVVDVASTTARTQLTRETLDLLPLAGRQSLVAVMAAAPGVRSNLDVGGDTSNEMPVFRAFGQVGEPWVTNEGVATTFAVSGSGFGQYFDYQSFEEAAVQTIGNDAEMPTKGLRVISLVKSGGNDFHGDVMYAQVPPKLQSNNVDDALRAQGVEQGSPLKKRYDFGVDMGGRIIRDKLWWYSAYRRRNNIELVEGSFKPNGEPGNDVNLAWFTTNKMSYQATRANRFVFYHEQAMKWEVANEDLADYTISWENRTNDPTTNRVDKIEWQGVFGNSFVASLQQGHAWILNRGFTTDRGPTADREPGSYLAPLTRDIFFLRTSGEAQTSARRLRNNLFHTKGSASWYKPDSFHGNHDLKAGFDFIPAWTTSGSFSRESGNFHQIFNNGAPFQIVTLGNPAFPVSKARYLGIFVRDSWSIARRLTLNLGVRYAQDPGWIPEQCQEAGDFVAARCIDRIDFPTFQSLSPRLHLAYDVRGNGRTLVKGGWGRFYSPRTPGVVAAVNPLAIERVTYRWTDPNGNRMYDPGEVNLDRNGPAFVSIAGGSTTVVNPDERQPMVDELSATLEHQLVRDFAIRVTGVYSREKDWVRTVNQLRPPEAYNIPVTRPDPGPDGRVGTSDDPGTTLTYFEFPVSLRGRAFERNTRFNALDDKTYKSFEVAASKRLSNRWLLLASYTSTKKHEPPTGPVDRNSEIFTENNTLEWGFKLNAAYILPSDVTVSGSFDHRSGDPWARTVLLTGGVTIPSITIPVEPIGTRRLPHLNVLNARVEKGFFLRGSQKVVATLNIYNLTNVNTLLNVQRRSGPTFLRPIPGGTEVANNTIVQPRLVEFGVAYRF